MAAYKDIMIPDPNDPVFVAPNYGYGHAWVPKMATGKALSSAKPFDQWRFPILVDLKSIAATIHSNAPALALERAPIKKSFSRVLQEKNTNLVGVRGGQSPSGVLKKAPLSMTKPRPRGASPRVTQVISPVTSLLPKLAQCYPKDADVINLEKESHRELSLFSNACKRHIREVNKDSKSLIQCVKSLLASKVRPTTRDEYRDLIALVVDHDDSKLEEQASVAEFLLHDMLRTARPDGLIYNQVLRAFAETGNVVKAEELVKLMCTRFDGGDTPARPTRAHYSSLFRTWRKAHLYYGPERCEEILELMYQLYPSCKPDTSTYTSVLHCWIDSGRPDAAYRAEELFRKMLKRYENGDSSAKPDRMICSIVVTGMVELADPDRAEALLWEMAAEHQHHFTLQRDLYAILSFWSESKADEAPERAEILLRRWVSLMGESFMPNKNAYNLILKSWTTSTHKDAPERVMDFLLWLKSPANDGNDAARLDSFRYSLCVSFFIDSKCYTQAAKLLEMMTTDYCSGNQDVRPESRRLTSLIKKCCSHNHTAEADTLVRCIWALKENDKGKSCSASPSYG